MPTTPFCAGRQTIEPSVSVPMATVAKFAATPAPEPEDEPHGLRRSTYGLLVRPPTPDQPLLEFVERKLAHSEQVGLADDHRAGLPQLAGEERVLADGAAQQRERPGGRRLLVLGAMLSLSRIGMPSSGERAPCVRRCRSLAAATFRASGLTARTALTFLSSTRIRSRVEPGQLHRREPAAVHGLLQVGDRGRLEVGDRGRSRSMPCRTGRMAAGPLSGRPTPWSRSPGSPEPEPAQRSSGLPRYGERRSSSRPATQPDHRAG